MIQKSKTQRKLLSIDGGGLRGMIAVRLVAGIESILRKQSGNETLVLADYFDYIGGTSTGAIIAAALSKGMSAAELDHFFRNDARHLFALTHNPFKRFLYARYDADPLAEKLKSVFGSETTLGSPQLKTLLLMVMLNAATSSPWPVSNNPDAKYNDAAFGEENNLKLPLWKLLRASAAAPYFFEPEEIQIGSSNFLFFDGALTSLNNPAFKLFQMATLPCYRLNWATGEDRLLLVSLGTGMWPKEINQLRFWDKQIGTTMINAMQSLMFAGTAEVDLQCRAFGKVLAGDPVDSEVGDLIGDSPAGCRPLYTYLRYNALLTEKGLAPLGCAGELERTSFRLDDVTAIDSCVKVGDAIVEKQMQPSHFAAFHAL